MAASEFKKELFEWGSATGAAIFVFRYLSGGLFEALDEFADRMKTLRENWKGK
jgi:hypothetical protein